MIPRGGGISINNNKTRLRRITYAAWVQSKGRTSRQEYNAAKQLETSEICMAMKY